MPPHDLTFVRRVVALLAGAGIETWLFGGWAEELLGLAAPRAHGDVDLLYPAEGFDRVDALLRSGWLEEILAKRLPHKRAFLLDGVLVELVLVQRDERGCYTLFWGATRHDWPRALRAEAGGFAVATAEAMSAYRAAHDRLARRVG